MRKCNRMHYFEIKNQRKCVHISSCWSHAERTLQNAMSILSCVISIDLAFHTSPSPAISTLHFGAAISTPAFSTLAISASPLRHRCSQECSGYRCTPRAKKNKIWGGLNLDEGKLYVHPRGRECIPSPRARIDILGVLYGILHSEYDDD